MSAIPLQLQWSSQGRGDLQDLYWSMQTKMLWGRICSFLTGHTRSLLDLTTEVSRSRVHSRHYAGTRTVLMNRIKSSEGRSRDFDCDFNPLNSRTRDRWINIAKARAQGETLPLVELIQLGDDYFVRDGHHRISVARAFGEAYVDAKVIVLESTQVLSFPQLPHLE